MTEGFVQCALFTLTTFQTAQTSCPNVGLFGWEADFVAVTLAGLAHEVEVKVSRADYRAEQRRIDAGRYGDPKVWRHNVYSGRKVSSHYPHANYFWYAVPDALSDHVLETAPDYAGVISVNDNGLAKYRRRAPRLHTEKMSDRSIAFLHRGVALRYWQAKRKLEQAEDWQG